jgi:hypothetical protein
MKKVSSKKSFSNKYNNIINETSIKNIEKIIKEKNIQIVDLKFNDLPGLWQHFSIPVSELYEIDDPIKSIWLEGIGFDGSSIRGFQKIQESDMILIPDPTTAVVDPVCEVPTLSILCDIYDPLTKKPYTRDPRYIAKKAEKYLKEAKKEFGSWTMAAAAYNRGFKGLKDAVLSQKETDYYKLYLNPETYRYVFRILALKIILNNPEKYNFDLQNSDQYKPYKLKKVEVKESISSLPDFAKLNKTTYKELILHNPWIRTGKYNFEVPAGKIYEFLIPD